MTHQCPSCGGFCKKSGCERRDAVVPCKHFVLGMTNLTAADCPYCEIDNLKAYAMHERSLGAEAPNMRCQELEQDLQESANALATAHETIEAMQQVEPMNAVAIEYAHRLALELECVLADRNTNWDRAMNLIGEYRSAMNAIHEQHSPTHMGEPVLGAAIGEKAR